MTALLAMIVGILAVGYAAWPLVRGREALPPTEGREHGRQEAEEETAALLAWSTAAGETGRAVRGLDPEEFPK
ncbi:MAG: hypothetical protein GTO46_13765 [Gemmatimonadetes bacterium]|nr:hypothetical protein [Gemmatimonadota bacterium]NIO32648.1 hypothetical protein [Gemmatimonadota bacterium]